MTQLTFQNIRNLGAEQQPAAHHQPERLPDLRQRHLDQGQAHAQERRQPDAALARDPQRRHRSSAVFNFNNNMTSNCAGQPAGCTDQQRDRLRRRQLHARPRQHQDPQPVRRRAPTPRSGPRYALYVQDDFRATSRLTLNLGLRWDVYPPWIEVNDRQSNFDETTGTFVVASDDAMIAGRQGRTPPADLLEARPRPAPRLRLRPHRQRQDGASAAASASSGTSRPAAPRRPRRRTRRSCSRRRSTPTPTAYGVNLLLKDGLPPPPGVDPTRPAAGTTRSIFDINFRDAYARQWNVNVQRRLGDQLHGRSRATSARRAGRCCSRATPTRRRRSSA